MPRKPTPEKAFPDKFEEKNGSGCPGRAEVGKRREEGLPRTPKVTSALGS